MRSFELSKATLKPQAFLLGLVAAGSEVFQLKPAWLPSGVLSETTHEPAGRSEAGLLADTAAEGGGGGLGCNGTGADNGECAKG